MVDARLLEEFEKMDAPMLRHLLTLVCDSKSFKLKHGRGKLHVWPGKVFFNVDGFHDSKPELTDFKDCENYKEGEEDEVEDEVEEVPKKPSAEIRHLIKLNKRKYPAFDPTSFECENCHEQFDILSNSEHACNWHKGHRITDLEDVIWADHDVEKDGAIEDLIDDWDYEDRWMWTCCGQMGSDWGCKTTRHKVLEEFEDYEDLSDVEDSSDGSSESSSDESEEDDGSHVSEDLFEDLSDEVDDIDEPAAKRVKH